MSAAMRAARVRKLKRIIDPRGLGAQRSLVHEWRKPCLLAFRQQFPRVGRIVMTAQCLIQRMQGNSVCISTRPRRVPRPARPATWVRRANRRSPARKSVL